MPIFDRLALLATCLAAGLTARAETPAAIDAPLAQRWKQAGVVAAPRCDNDAFLRRVTLDLIGRIPTRDELHAFRELPDRAAKIDALLDSPDFARFWSEVWTSSLVGYDAREFQTSREPLRAWLEQRFAEDAPYDDTARRLIAAEGDSAFDGPPNFMLRHREQPAVKVSRFFLGVRLDCARCHDHPFDRWKQEDFEHFSRFFESVDYREVSEGNFRVFERPVDSEEERPRFLTGSLPRTRRWRDELALMIVRCKPFARNFANRVWYQLLGRGIVDPPDDFSSGENVAPELLEDLADFARRSDFRLRPMVRAICVSQAYQRSSRWDGEPTDRARAERLFAVFRPKPLTVVQQVDAYAVASGASWSPVERLERIQRLRRRLLEEDASETWTFRDSTQSVMETLASPVRARVDKSELFEVVLSRAPTDEELELIRGQPTARVAFALLYGNEFRFNH